MDKKAYLPHPRLVAWLLGGLGLFHLPLVAAHLAFPRTFGWGEQLPRLSAENAGLVLCYHGCILFWLSSMGAITLAESIQRTRGKQTPYPRSVWLWIAVFYLFRLIIEIPCFGLTTKTIPLMAALGGLTMGYFATWVLLAPRPTSKPTVWRTDAIATLLH